MPSLRRSLSTLSSSVLIVSIAAISIGLIGCGDDDDAPAGTAGTSGSSATAGTAGSSANAGASGSSGDAGTSGSAGSAGTGGMAGTAGSAGTSGASGTSGTAGAGGTAGSSGSSGSAGSSVVCPGPTDMPVMLTAPALLSETGLYADITTDTLNAEILKYTPLYPLWSDGAEKHRFAYIPSCAPIDTSVMDNWSFPIGTRFWKEFYVDNIRVETRLIHRFGPGAHDWVYGAYLWNDTNTDATVIPEGQVDAKGTTHDVPPVEDCKSCHEKLPEKILGFSAFQLTHDAPGETMQSLSAMGRLSVPAPDGFHIPGNDVEVAALGYLHANCGNCHNDTGLPTMRMRVKTTDATVEDTATFKSTVNKVGAWSGPGVTHRITPGDPSSSAVYYRMNQRGNTDQMPQVGTEIVDPTGLDVVSTWILSLPPDANLP